MYKRALSIISVIFLTLFLVGCNGEEKASVAKVETNVDISLAALYAGKSSISRALKVVTGELQAYNVTTGTTDIFAWSAYLNDTDLNVTSNKTIVLEPGSYQFSLLLNDGNNQYVGTAVYEVLDASQNTIPLSVAPVIGDTVFNVSVIANLATYKLSYSVSELSALTNPQVGISVDSGAESIFTINKSTGLSQAFLNLPDGAHNVHLNFYDGNVQVGRSAPAQENITVVAGDPINIDIVALHGATEFTLDVIDSNATIKANIVQDIIDEIGLANLQVIMVMSDGNTTTYENNMTLVTEANSTYGITTVPGMQYGTYNFQLTFNDLSDTSVPVGSCVIPDVVLSTAGSTLNCQISLQRRSVLGGNLLATVGINVFNTNNEPVAGASVYANGTLIGLTNSGTFGTSGYLKTFHTAGDVVFRAEDATNFGEVNSTLSPLGVSNVDIFLDTLIVPVVNPAPSYASGKPWKYDYNATGNALVWEDTNKTLPANLYSHKLAVIGDFIYIFGGSNGGPGVYSDKIYKASINTPTQWEDTNITLPNSLAYSELSVIGNSVYLFSGYNYSSYTNAIYSASTSTPTQWSLSGSLPIVLSHSQSVVIGDYVYLFTGDSGGSATNTILRAAKNNPTSWTVMPSTLPTAVSYSQVTVIDNFIYLFANYLGNGISNNKIYKASIDTPTQWVEMTSTLPGNLGISQTAVIGNYVYLFGGFTDTVSKDVIYRAPISDLTQWEDTTKKLPGDLYGSQVAIIGDYVYLFGGNSSAGYTNKIYRAYIK